MDGMEERMGNAENRKQPGQACDHPRRCPGEMLKGHREEILEIRRNNERLAIIQRDVVEMLKEQRRGSPGDRRDNIGLATVQRDIVEMLKGQRLEILEMKRFNQQTRQLWVLIARKMDWLDEDLDIDSL